MAPQATCTRRRSRNDVCERCVSSSSSLGTCARRCRRVMHACVCLRCESLSLALKACATCKRFRCKRSVEFYAIRRYGAIKAKNFDRRGIRAAQHTTQEQPASAACKQDGPPPAPAHPQTTSETQRPQISTKVASYERRDVVAEGHVQHSLYCRFWTHSDETSDEGRGAVCCS